MRMTNVGMIVRGGAALAALMMVSCLDSGGNSTAVSKQGLYGKFKVELIEQTSYSEAYASILGRVSDGPTPSTLAWTVDTASGSCSLRIPRAPFCDPGCGSAAACVADGVCQAYPHGLSVGTVTVNGIKLTSGPTSFSMNPVLNNYQVPTGSSLNYPPFAEGDVLTFSAAGADTIGGFSLSVKAIKPLVVSYDTVSFVDGQPVTLTWTPKGSAATSTVTAQVDISHHGGLKGVIDCEGPDNGQLVIPARLVSRLMALGISGFPAVELVRTASATHPDMSVELQVLSRVTRPVSIPGIVSCSGDEDCPENQTCQQDFKCQ